LLLTSTPDELSTSILVALSKPEQAHQKKIENMNNEITINAPHTY
jgi:hypothetical protein